MGEPALALPAAAPPPSPSELALTPDQAAAEAAILDASHERGGRYLLTGYAGSGKTTLVARMLRVWMKRRRKLAMTAPTHKAVAVLAAKGRAAGLTGSVDFRTIHSLLSLKPAVHGDRKVFERDKAARPVEADIVVIDEASMLNAELMQHIRRYMPMAFVLFVGDPAQLPPVGEAASEAFDIKARSHLGTVVRQAADNPILAAATAIRESQGKAPDWSWARSTHRSGAGVFVPRDPWEWMREGFTRPAFDADPDTLRYLAWTNARVAEVNAMVRAWRYGRDIATPFVAGEFAMFRAPVVREGGILFATNEEARVVSIARGAYRHRFEQAGSLPEWEAEVPSWRIEMERRDGTRDIVHMPADQRAVREITDRIRDEAAEQRIRWKHLHEFDSALARLQSIYALTIHNSQGSTFKHAFVDIADIRPRFGDNTLEAQQLLYVAATRPTTSLVLVGL